MTSKPSRTTFRQRLDEMVTVLRDDIITGRRAAGDYLPSEVALAEQFQLSKNSVRKGLERLVEEKLIEKVPRVGNRIADPGPQAQCCCGSDITAPSSRRRRWISLSRDSSRLIRIYG